MGCVGFFIVGCFLGGFVAVFVLGLCIAAGKKTPEVSDENRFDVSQDA
jgi:hypothetical protein